MRLLAALAATLALVLFGQPAHAQGLTPNGQITLGRCNASSPYALCLHEGPAGQWLGVGSFNPTAHTFTPFLPNGQIFVGNASGLAAPVTPSGDCTISTAGAIVCTKTNGTAFGPIATLGIGSSLSSGGGNLNVTVANPTGTMGLATVNGSATTLMRSDAAVAFNQALAPTNTGIWTFSNATNSAIFNGGTVSVNGPGVNSVFSGTYVDSGSTFGGFNVGSLFTSTQASTHATAQGTFSITRNSAGGNTNGAGNSDFGAIISSTKTSYLTTAADGEQDALWLVTAQGSKGDAGGLDIGVSKVSGGTGGAVGVESNVTWNAPTTGAVQYSFHGIQGLAEGAGGRSGATGYGMFIESWAGTGYAAYYGGADNTAYGGSPAWQYLLVGATTRAASPYFTIAAGTGNIVTSGSLQLGTVLATQYGGTGNAGGTWSTYTPTLACGSGALTTASATGRYEAIGKVIHIEIVVTITTNGTCATVLTAGLPAVSAANYVIAGRENGVSGKELQGLITTSSSTLNIYNYDNTYPGANSASIIISGVYEST